jgi:hypothetical protein
MLRYSSSTFGSGKSRPALQHFLVGRRRAGRGLLDDGQLQLDEENLADLLGRTEVERAARQFVRLLLELHDARAQFGRLHAQQRGVDQHAVALDLVQHHGGRQLDLAVDEGEFRIGFDVALHGLVQAQRDVGILAGILGRAAQLDLVEADLAAPLPHTSMNGMVV